MLKTDYKPSSPEVWCVALPPHDLDAPELANVVDSAQRTEISRFKNASDRHSRLVAHALMRMRAADILDRAPASLRTSRSPAGKPRLDCTTLDVNLSHCRSMVCAGFLSGGSVGVDVEPVDADIRNTLQEMIQTVLLPHEAAALYRLAAPADQSFLRWWTLKEAVIKASGHGLSRSLQSFSIEDIDTQPKVVFHDASDPCRLSAWHLQQWLHEGHFVALAWCHPERGVVSTHTLSLLALRNAARTAKRLMPADAQGQLGLKSAMICV